MIQNSLLLRDSYEHVSFVGARWKCSFQGAWLLSWKTTFPRVSDPEMLSFQCSRNQVWMETSQKGPCHCHCQGKANRNMRCVAPECLHLSVIGLPMISSGLQWKLQMLEWNEKAIFLLNGWGRGCTIVGPPVWLKDLPLASERKGRALSSASPPPLLSFHQRARTGLSYQLPHWNLLKPLARPRACFYPEAFWGHGQAPEGPILQILPNHSPSPPSGCSFSRAMSESWLSKGQLCQCLPASRASCCHWSSD